MRRCLCKRYRCGTVGRMPKPVIVKDGLISGISKPYSDNNPISLEIAEVEALRLVDLEKTSMEEAGKRMNVSRNTIWRLVGNARKKITQAIIEGRKIKIQKSQKV